MGVAAVDEDVAGLEQGGQLVEDRVDRAAGLDHDHDLARALERGDQILDVLTADQVLPHAAPTDEFVDLGGGPVEDRHGVAVALHVQDEVFPHHGQADQANVGARLCHRLCSIFPIKERRSRQGISSPILIDESGAAKGAMLSDSGTIVTSAYRNRPRREGSGPGER